MATATKRPSAVMVDCPGVKSEGRQRHAMRDGCWSCAPFWERVPICPTHHKKLAQSGYCRECRRFYAIEE